MVIKRTSRIFAASLAIFTACKPVDGSQVANAVNQTIYDIKPQEWVKAFVEHEADQSFVTRLAEVRAGSIKDMLSFALQKTPAGGVNFNGVRVENVQQILKQNRGIIEGLDKKYRSLGDFLDKNGGGKIVMNQQTLQQTANVLRDYQKKAGSFALIDDQGLGLTNACQRSTGATAGCGSVAGVGVGSIVLGALLCLTGVGCAAGGPMMAGGAGAFGAGGTCAGVAHGVAVAHCDPNNSTDKSRLDQSSGDLNKAVDSALNAKLPTRNIDAGNESGTGG